MADIIYGLINRVDASVLEDAIESVFKDFPGETINYLEVGLYNGRTTSGIKQYMDGRSIPYNLTGIDNFKDKEDLVFYPKEANLIQGSSIEVYNQIPDLSQHLILIDANHSLPYVIADTMFYKDKVKAGGYLAFHDAAPHSQNKSYQRMGSESDPDMYISVLKALEKLGFIGEDNIADHWGFKLIAHKWDETDEGGGTIIFRREK